MAWGVSDTQDVFVDFFGPAHEVRTGIARWVCRPDGATLSVTLVEREGVCIARLEGSWPELGDLAHIAFLEVRSARQAVWLVRRLLESVPRGTLRWPDGRTNWVG